MYKNGGVGALGQMGTQEAAVRAERWAWVTITRKEGELRTYVNGRLCAEVKLQTKEDEAKKRKSKEKAEREARGGKERADREGGEGGEGGGAGSGGGEGGGGGGDGKRQTAAERFAIDPKQLALFALGAHGETPEGAAAGGAAGAGSEEEGPERGLALRFVRLESKCWGAEATSPDLA